MPHAWVVVLGDVGRSPRMQYHTSSLCKTEGYSVNLVGYRGADVIAELQAPLADGRLTLSYIPDLPSWVGHLPRPLALPFKALIQLIALLWMLLVSLPRPDVILLQLPPALPTMIACWLAARRHGARLIYDWHNFAYTLMALTMGRGAPLVRIAEKYERYWGRKADGGLCVTKAMQMELERGWGVDADVFYDRPPEFFRAASLQEKHELLLKLEDTSSVSESMHLNDFAAVEIAKLKTTQSAAAAAAAATTREETLCTTILNPGIKGAIEVVEKEDRPMVVVSSTSWTPDEDFGLLLAAARLYDKKAQERSLSSVTLGASKSKLPNLLIFVTGRGPQRAEYEAQMRQLDLRHVAFRTVWLEPEDYPLLLGSADLGISLHSSSSGLDLPMKVVDMFGAGLPVCALSYSCIGELVSHGRNGLLFSSAEELAVEMQDVFGSGKEGSNKMLERLRKGVAGSNMARWHDNWVKIALPVLEGTSSTGGGGGGGGSRRSRRTRA